jgi:hypothetical protein
MKNKPQDYVQAFGELLEVFFGLIMENFLIIIIAVTFFASLFTMDENRTTAQKSDSLSTTDPIFSIEEPRDYDLDELEDLEWD